MTPPTPTSPRPLWTPSPERAAASNLAAFARLAAARGGPDGDAGYEALHAWSVRQPDAFWTAVWDFTGVIGERGERVIEPGPGPGPIDELMGTRFFPDARLSFTENLMRRGDDSPAILFAGEDGRRSRVSWRELAALVSRIQQALVEAGVGEGDRVGAWVPNCPEGYALMLATAGLGAVFTSCSPDFGVDGLVDRFGQVEPAVLVGVDGYVFGGRRFDCRARVGAAAARLPSLRRVVVLGFLDDEPDLAAVPGARSWSDWLAPHDPTTVTTTRLAFDHPLYVLFSSGTTGLPKCIVHRAGGVLLKHLLEHQLHCDVHPGDRVFYFTTAGWMMWNWLATMLASEATIVLYDGSPVHPETDSMWALAEETGLTLFGTSARFLDGCARTGLHPMERHDLTSLRTITSTGSPLVAERFAYVYEHVKGDVHLASISGGTDLCGALVGGDPTSPVWAGEIQRPVLGQAIAVLDDTGRPLGPDEPGELVCTNAFPSMPLRLWDDPGDERYRATYFERFPGAWHQGDFAAWTHHGGIVLTGRSDATLNAGGVRIGTAELYRQLDAFDEVAEALAVSQDWDGDTRVVLFVVLRDGATLTPELLDAIRAQIRSGASPRHVPSRIVAVPDLPRTRSGKLSELAVRDVINGREVANAEALANPESLAAFRDLVELSS